MQNLINSFYRHGRTVPLGKRRCYLLPNNNYIKYITYYSKIIFKCVKKLNNYSKIEIFLYIICDLQNVYTVALRVFGTHVIVFMYDARHNVILLKYNYHLTMESSSLLKFVQF